jgi:hypothetical protein
VIALKLTSSWYQSGSGPVASLIRRAQWDRNDPILIMLRSCVENVGFRPGRLMAAETLLAWSAGWGNSGPAWSCPRPSDFKGRTAFQGEGMAACFQRAYELWQQAGQPSGKDDEFYHQAKKELQQALDKENQPRPA